MANMEQQPPSSSSSDSYIEVSSEEIYRFYSVIMDGGFSTEAQLFGALFVLYCAIHPSGMEPDPDKWESGARTFIERESLRLKLDVVVIPKVSGLPS